jgi:lambda family phage portal protein
VFEQLRRKFARWISPPQKSQTRQYAMAKPSRLTSGWGNQTTSEDSELSSSLRTARARSRELIRDAAYAKRAKVIVQNNVVGPGIGMQAKVQASKGTLNDMINDDIENTWEDWACASSCHTGGALHFSDLERVAIGQVFEAGEVFIRIHHEKFGNSKIPFALEVIEAERIADEFQPSALLPNTAVRLGIETDSFHRPVAYWLRTTHPGELRLTPEQTTRLERVPAENIIHLRIIERWPQTRAMPWMHAAARKLNDMDGLTEAEITAARGAACYMGFIQSPTNDSNYGEEQADGSSQVSLEPAIVEKLAPGETFNFAAPNRPNAQLDPFMRMMLREVAAGSGCSYESLSRDYSQSNYSSSRLALMDDRDLWRMLQLWFIRSFRQLIHKQWLQAAVLSRTIQSISVDAYALNLSKFEQVRFKPRGWSWIDPTSEVEAYKEAIRAGFTTVSHVIAQTGDGRDLEDVLNERAQELDMMKAKELVFDTDPSTVVLAPLPVSPTDTQGTQPAEKTDGQGDDPAVEQAEKMLRTFMRSFTRTMHR